MAKILLSGSHGFVGKRLISCLETRGDQLVCLVRSKEKQSFPSVYWDPLRGNFSKDAFEGFDTIIHLAGENIASRRWNKKGKNALFLSRCRDTWLLSQLLTRLCSPPKTLITASAVGIYGNRGEEILTEESVPGSGFLADLCIHWESATHAIEQRGTRVVHTRFGLVLDKEGGMLPKLLPSFILGLGAVLGSGDQIMPWVALDDVVGAICHIIDNEQISGPVNVVSPYPVTQKEFAKALAAKLHRRALVKAPKCILKLLLGQKAEELLFSSQNVQPSKLQKSGYTFLYPHLDEALNRALHLR